MNIYRHRFTTKCPNNNQVVEYDLTICSFKMIEVERIQAKCAEYKEGFHEYIADQLRDIFGGVQMLTAWHHGTSIRTFRGRV